MVSTNTNGKTNSKRSAAATVAATAAATAAATDQTMAQSEALAELDEQPVARQTGDREFNGDSQDEIGLQRERVAALFAGIRQAYMDQFGEYPNDVVMQTEGFKYLISREFGINLMKLGAMRAEATGMDKESAYLSILADLEVDTASFTTRSVSGELRFNWQYFRHLSFEQARAIKDRILSVYSGDLKKKA